VDFKRILIAVKDSPTAMRAAKAGFDLARRLEALTCLIYVVDKSRELVNADLGITPEQSGTILLHEAEKTIEQLIRTYGAVDRLVHFTPEGFPGKEILQIAREWKADLIVMGTHERSWFNSLLSGSVTEYILKHAEIPVMITPAGR
jgi:nucleotide-binding universal stress UspA family protein